MWSANWVTLALAVVAAGLAAAVPQEAALPGAGSKNLQAEIDKLGSFEHADRAAASKLLRRAPGRDVVPLLSAAVRSHKDGYVRFRAGVLLTGFDDPATPGLMAGLMADPNDRLRHLAYRYFEHHPNPTAVPRLLASLVREHAEFVRPALLRALAARGSDARIQSALVRDINRGETIFRSAVIEALGDYQAGYAVEPLIAATRLEGGLRLDAAIALGKIKDTRALNAVIALQTDAPASAQPEVAAAICLLGVNCQTHVAYLERTLRFAEKNPGHQELVRSAARGLGALGATGNEQAIDLLVTIASPARDPLRAPLALAIGSVALRNPAFLLGVLEKRPRIDGAAELIAEALEMLEEDADEERFFAMLRHAYWAAPEGSASRSITQALLQKLDF
jgi:HEAT repeat protein